MRRQGSVSLRMQTDLTVDSIRLKGLEGKARRPADIRAMQELPSSLEQTVKLTPELFKQLDTDHNGFVTFEEFAPLPELLGLDSTPEATQALFNSIDDDESDDISLDELYAALKSTATRLGISLDR